MRAILVLAVCIGVALATAAFLSGRDERGRAPAASPGPVPAPDAAPSRPVGVPRDADAPTDRAALVAEPASQPGAMPAGGESDLEGAASAALVRERFASEFWRACVGKGSIDEIRACIREGIGAGMSPEELAALVCGEVPPDGPDRLLIEEVAARWDPVSAPARIREFHSLCNSPGIVWSEFLELQSERDPAWVDAFVGGLAPELVFEGDDIVLLQAVAQLAPQRPELRDVLARGARGELGGSDRQVAFAVTRSLAFLRDASARLDFLREVFASDSFRGRPAEVQALVRGAFDGGAAADDALALVGHLLEDPRTVENAARQILALERANAMPASLSADAWRTLVERARAVLPSGS